MVLLRKTKYTSMLLASYAQPKVAYCSTLLIPARILTSQKAHTGSAFLLLSATKSNNLKAYCSTLLLFLVEPLKDSKR